VQSVEQQHEQPGAVKFKTKRHKQSHSTIDGCTNGSGDDFIGQHCATLALVVVRCFAVRTFSTATPSSSVNRALFVAEQRQSTQQTAVSRQQGFVPFRSTTKRRVSAIQQADESLGRAWSVVEQLVSSSERDRPCKETFPNKASHFCGRTMQGSDSRFTERFANARAIWRRVSNDALGCGAAQTIDTRKGRVKSRHRVG
jgi:hypothetical protein